MLRRPIPLPTISPASAKGEGMAIGEHWEWRGFGKPAERLRSRILGLPAKFPHPQEVLDEYIWSPGGRCGKGHANLKLREDSLKWKRLRAKKGSLEMWNEDPAENHGFPLGPDVIAKLLGDLGLARREAASAANRMELLELIRSLAPAARVIPVRKKRWQMEWEPGGATVELAEIFVPESVTSIGLEHPETRKVEEARDALGLPGPLLEMSYVDAVARWARGEKLAST